MYSTGYSCQILKKLGFSRYISKNNEIWNSMEICPVAAELYNADGRTDTWRSFSQFLERPKNNSSFS